MRRTTRYALSGLERNEEIVKELLILQITEFIEQCGRNWERYELRRDSKKKYINRMEERS
jgi:hypothetical protein